MADCTCDGKLKNTGTSVCAKEFKAARQILIGECKNTDGSRKTIDPTMVDQVSYWDGLFQNADAKDRFYPLTQFENYTAERADNIQQTFPSGVVKNVSQGAKTVTFEIVGYGPAYKKKIEAIGCKDVCFWLVDKSGNLRGINYEGELRGIKIAKGTYDVRLVEATDTTCELLRVSFQWDLGEEDSSLEYIDSSDIAINLLTDAEGLLDVNGTIVSATTTEVVVKLESCFGALGNKEAVPSVGGSILVTTDGTTAIPGTVVEDPSGTYTYTFTTPLTGGDPIVVSLDNGVLLPLGLDGSNFGTQITTA